VRIAHRVRTAAAPGQVWEVLGRAARWPEIEASLRRVRGTHGEVSAGQTLVGVARFASLAIPIDVVEAERPSRLVLRVHIAPGVRELVTFDIVPVVTGGSDVHVTVQVDGLFAPLVHVPLWLARGLTARVLAVRSDRLARAAERAA
jgi:hypothetical protein